MANTGNTQQQINYGAAANDGQGDPLRTAFIKTDDNFDNIWLAGPVGSNITIVNNTIQSNNTNGNIVLRPNGVGVIQANASIVPNSSGLRDLGSSAQRWRSLYVSGLDTANLVVSSDLSVPGNAEIGGNLTVQGDIIQVGNIVTDTLTIQLANTASNSAQANGAGITVGANDAIATLLYDSSFNAWFTNNGLRTTANVNAGNLRTTGLVVATGNIQGGNIQGGTLSGQTLVVNNITGEFPITIQTNGGGTWEFAGNTLRAPQGGTWSSDADTAYFNSPANGYLNLTSLLNGNVVSELFMEHSSIRFFIDNGIDATWQLLADGRTEFPSYTFPYADGNAGEVLKTDGAGNLAWTTDSSDYGNANVATFLASFGSNTISTTGNVEANYFLGNGSLLTGIASTGNITFTDTTMSPPDGVDITISAANSEVIIEAFDIRLDATDDLRLTGSDLVSLRNRSTTDPVTIITDYDDSETTWTFAVDGTLTTPGDIVVAGDVTGTAGANTLVLKAQPASNTSIQLNSIVDSVISTVANLEIRTDVSDTARTWEFDTNGNLIFPSNGQLVMDNGDGTIGNQGDNFVISWDNEDLVLRSVAGDVDVESDNDFNIRVNYDADAGDYLSKWIFTQNNDIVNITGNSAIVTEAGNLNLQGGRDTLSSGNVQITAVDNGVAINTWTFDNTGNLVVPGNINFGGDACAAPSLNDFSSVTAAGDFDVVTGTGGTARTFEFGADGRLILPESSEANVAKFTSPPNDANVSLQLYSGNAVRIVSNTTGEPFVWTFGTTGTFTAAGNISAGNITTTGRISASGNILGLNFGTEGSVQASSVEATGNITGANLSVTGNITGNTAGFAIGYRDIPQVSFTGNVTMAAADAGKHFYSTESTDYILTIANNASQGFAVGAAITIVNQGTGNITVAQGSGVSLYLAGNATAGNRTVSTFGMATIMKVSTDTWFINGTGVS